MACLRVSTQISHLQDLPAVLSCGMYASLNGFHNPKHTLALSSGAPTVVQTAHLSPEDPNADKSVVGQELLHITHT